LQLRRNFGVFPVEAEVRSVVDEAVRAFADAGAVVEQVEFGLKRTQRELSDAWTRLMIPLNVGALEGMKAFGIDLMGEHRDDFPPDLSQPHRRRPQSVRYGRHARSGDPHGSLRRDPERIGLRRIACRSTLSNIAGSTSAPRLASTKGARWAIKPEMKWTSRLQEKLSEKLGSSGEKV
jgi:hypothetical protein